MDETITSYNEITKGYIYKWRDANPDKYNEYHRKYYSVKKENPEWRLKHNERCKEYNRKHKLKMRNGQPPKPRGRPKKKMDFISILEEKLNNVVSPCEVFTDDVDITDDIITL
tara:strand:- start:2259 stop:2597 length:339 start_codon:yes stop_codon:yes gene_type:complete